MRIHEEMIQLWRLRIGASIWVKSIHRWLLQVTCLIRSVIVSTLGRSSDGSACRRQNSLTRNLGGQLQVNIFALSFTYLFTSLA